MTSGYEAAHQRAEEVARILHDVATLVGERREDEAELKTGGSLVPGLGFREDAAALEIRARDLEQGLFKIIVLGEFKNGKSTLLNAMLGSKMLPAKAAPATAVITVLVYGDDSDVEIHESGKAEPRRVSWGQYARDFQLTLQDQETLEGHGTIDRFRDVEYAQIECRHRLCANGVKLIDSPGLGEHLSRTRVATGFLKQSQAVIFVLNATRILTQDERDFIGRLSNVFFIVNRINQVDERSVPEIKSWVERSLEIYFRDDAGAFDRELYQRRVFFVNARGALDARSATPIDEELLQASGVPALEEELERFLTGGQRVQAALESSARFLEPVIGQAWRRIEQGKSALDQPLEELEARRLEAQKRLDALAGRRSEIERTILMFGDVVREKVYRSLRSFVEEMEGSWQEDSRQLMDLDKAVNIKSVLQSYAQAEARERMAAAIAEQVQRYLQSKFGEWSDRIPDVVQGDLARMTTEVEAQVEDIQLELDDIACLFAGTPSSAGTGPHVSGKRLIQLAVTLEDISGLTENVAGLGDWKNLLGRWIQQAVIIVIVGTLVTGSLFTAFLIVEGIRMGLHESEVKKRIREKLGEKLQERLREQVVERREFIYETVDRHFRQFASGLTGVIERQIEEVRAEQDRILQQRRDERFSVEREKQRLDAIGYQLSVFSNQLSELITGNR